MRTYALDSVIGLSCSRSLAFVGHRWCTFLGVILRPRGRRVLFVGGGGGCRWCSFGSLWRIGRFLFALGESNQLLNLALGGPALLGNFSAIPSQPSPNWSYTFCDSWTRNRNCGARNTSLWYRCSSGWRRLWAGKRRLLLRPVGFSSLLASGVPSTLSKISTHNSSKSKIPPAPPPYTPSSQRPSYKHISYTARNYSTSTTFSPSTWNMQPMNRPPEGLTRGTGCLGRSSSFSRRIGVFLSWWVRRICRLPTDHPQNQYNPSPPTTN